MNKANSKNQGKKLSEVFFEYPTGFNRNKFNYINKGISRIDQIAFDIAIRIESISLMKNKIKNIKGMSQFDNLKILDLSHNLIDDPGFVMELQKLKNLEKLNIMNNFVMESPNIRQIVITSLPNLKQLNNEDITDYEREKSDAELKSQYEILEGIINYQLEINFFNEFVNRLILNNELNSILVLKRTKLFDLETFLRIYPSLIMIEDEYIRTITRKEVLRKIEKFSQKKDSLLDSMLRVELLMEREASSIKVQAEDLYIHILKKIPNTRRNLVQSQYFEKVLKLRAKETAIRNMPKVSPSKSARGVKRENKNEELNSKIRKGHFKRNRRGISCEKNISNTFISEDLKINSFTITEKCDLFYEYTQKTKIMKYFKDQIIFQNEITTKFQAIYKFSKLRKIFEFFNTKIIHKKILAVYLKNKQYNVKRNAFTSLKIFYEENNNYNYDAENCTKFITENLSTQEISFITQKNNINEIKFKFCNDKITNSKIFNSWKYYSTVIIERKKQLQSWTSLIRKFKKSNSLKSTKNYLNLKSFKKFKFTCSKIVKRHNFNIVKDWGKSISFINSLNTLEISKSETDLNNTLKFQSSHENFIKDNLLCEEININDFDIKLRLHAFQLYRISKIFKVLKAKRSQKMLKKKTFRALKINRSLQHRKKINTQIARHFHFQWVESKFRKICKVLLKEFLKISFREVINRLKEKDQRIIKQFGIMKSLKRSNEKLSEDLETTKRQRTLSMVDINKTSEFCALNELKFNSTNKKYIPNSENIVFHINNDGSEDQILTFRAQKISF